MFKVRHQNDAIGVVLVSLLLTLNYFTPCSSVSIVNFEQLNAYWVLTGSGNLQYQQKLLNLVEN